MRGEGLYNNFQNYIQLYPIIEVLKFGGGGQYNFLFARDHM